MSTHQNTASSQFSVASQELASTERVVAENNRGGMMAKLGLDYSRNLEDYSDEPIDSFSEFHEDDVDGYAGFVQWGDTSDPGDWQGTYFYVYQEALATNSSYVQDEWVRWGSGGQTRATNIRGSEFRLRYAISRRMNIVARLFLVDAIDFLEPGDITKEDGNRFRVDWNLQF